ncbi:hypothetical protein EV426DRAFT_618757 [Tirmania nivea]|nr:hypothetical protein EV426DRAFT_618757 [Tirmania nivea]
MPADWGRDMQEAFFLWALSVLLSAHEGRGGEDFTMSRRWVGISAWVYWRRNGGMEERLPEMGWVVSGSAHDGIPGRVNLVYICIYV